MTLTDAAELGLRERKRIATRKSIQRAVLELVAERGIDGVTVDEISHRAEVSPRTFFNYFPSKELALQGDPPQLPPEERLAAFVSAGPAESVMESMSRLLVDSVEQAINDLETVHLRHAVLKQYPQLFAMRMAAMRTFEEQIDEVVSRRLVADDPASAADPAAVANRAHLITLVAFAALRHAWSSWAHDESPGELTDRLTTSFQELATLFPPPSA